MGVIIGIIVWVLLAWLAGSIAEKKGRNFFVVFLVALLLSPIIGLIVALVLSESDKHRIARIEEEERIRAQYRDKNNQ